MNAIIYLTFLLCGVHVALAQHDVAVTFKKMYRGSVYQESGFSQKAFLEDTNTLYVLTDKSVGDEKQLDTRWVILSVDRIGKRIPPNAKAEGEHLEDLETPDKFVAVLYLVGGAGTQVSPAAPRLIGTRKQVICAKEGSDLKYYVPDKTILGGGSEMIPVGSMRRCIAYYEMGESVEIEAVEIFPTEMPKHMITSAKDESVKGKLIYVTPSPIEQTGSDKQTQSGKKTLRENPTVLIAGTPRANLKTDGKSIRKRSIKCIFDLRNVSKQSQTVTVKVFFVAAQNRSTQELVFDVREQEQVCEPNRITPVELTSDEVLEQNTYYDSSSRVGTITPKGAIIQIYCDDRMLSWASSNSLQKFKDEPDVVRQMGLLKSSTSD